MSEALYRKYRPKSFDEVIGQDETIESLRNAIKADNLGHAYLLTGGRGIGKTTIARIIAGELGVASEDIVELDAASNRGIDDARELREQVMARPFSSKYKVYILDEAHMLTKEASNALLKTLEEPPSYVKFILCTTNPEKLLPTIKSRCQHLKLKNPTFQNVLKVLRHVVTSEGISMSDKVMEAIARAHIESYRDAIVALEQVISFGDQVTEEKMLAHLSGGERQFEESLALLAFVLDKDLKSAILKISKLENTEDYFAYNDTTLLYDFVLKILRDLLVLKASKGDRSLISRSDSEFESLTNFLEKYKDKINSDTLRKLLECSRFFSLNISKEQALDMALITMCE